MSDEEEWRPVVGWEDTYEVSNLGRFKSLRTARVLNPWENRYGYKLVTLSVNRKRKHLLVSREVLKSFKGTPEEGIQALHWDGDKSNNRLSNLRWGTASDNMQDALRQGVNARARRTHCLRGHEFTPENTTYRKDRPTSRECRKCQTLYERERREKRAQQEPPTHGTVTGYISHKCRCEVCSKVFSDYQKTRRGRAKS